VHATGRQSPTGTTPLIEAFASRDAATRRDACARAVTDPSAVVWCDRLAERLSDPSDAVRDAASRALVAIGRDHDVAPLLKRVLRQRDRSGRWAAARALARLGPPSLLLLPTAVETFGSLRSSERWEAAHLVVDLGRSEPEVADLLRGLAQSGEPSTRRMACFCLRELTPGDPRSHSVLLATAQDPDPELRRAAYTALAGLLDPAPALLEALEQAERRETSPACRDQATRALRELTRRVTQPPRA